MSKKKTEDPAPDAESVDGEGAPEGGKKKPPLKLILIGAGALVILLGGGGAAAFFLLKPAPGAEAKKGEPKKEAKKEEKKDDKGKKGAGSGSALGEVRAGPDGVSFYTMPDLVVNMQVPDGRPTFLKLKLTFEISDAATLDEVQEDLPRIQDMFTAFLRELRPDDLAGSQGAYELKAEILRRVNLVLAPHKVDSVLIEEMLVQ